MDGIRNINNEKPNAEESKQFWSNIWDNEKEHERIFFFNWYSLHARLNSHYEAWSYKKRKHKKVKAYRKSI